MNAKIVLFELQHYHKMLKGGRVCWDWANHLLTAIAKMLKIIHGGHTARWDIEKQFFVRHS